MRESDGLRGMGAASAAPVFFLPFFRIFCRSDHSFWRINIHKFFESMEYFRHDALQEYFTPQEQGKPGRKFF